jgi:hypothetical protein
MHNARVAAIVAFYEVASGRIASAKVYREGVAEV